MAVKTQEVSTKQIRVRTPLRPERNAPKPPALNGLLRRTHLLSGLVAGVWLLVMAFTGVVLNHQETLGLHNVNVPNTLLPSHYADEFHPESNPLGVVISDLHSGRFFGPWGKLIGDAAALLLVVSVVSGGLYYWRRRNR